jgi:hypothetical protein
MQIAEQHWAQESYSQLSNGELFFFYLWDRSSNVGLSIGYSQK